jgi:hypothetical protein
MHPGEEGQRIGKTLLEHTWVDDWYKSTLTFTLTDDGFISGTYKHGHGTISGSLKVASLGWWSHSDAAQYICTKNHSWCGMY